MNLTQAQTLDAGYYNHLWQTLYRDGQISERVPPDSEMWGEDLGRSLAVTFDWLGNLNGLRVLELGCGPGDYTVMMARRGATVTALDIAPASLRVTQTRAAANQVDHKVTLGRMVAESLAFPDASFDRVVGFGLLHHADLTSLAPELRRVLKPGGKAIFREPLGANPLLEFVRAHVPYRHKQLRSPNEHPLDYSDIHRVGRHFRATRFREFYLLSMISRAVGSELSFPALWQIDEWLIERWPAVRRWCRYVLIEYVT